MHARSSFSFLLVAALLVAPAAHAFNLIGGSWPSGTIALRVQLDATAPTSPALPLTDGTTTWNALAQSVASDWNAMLGRSQFSLTTSTGATRQFGDAISDVFFSNNIYGQAFGSGVLAVTLVDYYDDDGFPSVRTREADLIVNRALTWDSYRGAIRSSPLDLRRVVLHEMGHVLGLDHPDQANPSDNLQVHNTLQNVAAIMNSRISSTETLQSDDIGGVNFLYRTAVARPIITNQPTSQTVSVAGNATLAPAINGGTPPVDALHGYMWFFKATGASTFEKLFTISAPTLTFGSAQLADAGTYYIEATTADDTVDSNQVTLTVNAISTSSTTALANLSTRGLAGAGNNSMIVGFVVTGTKNKTVLLRSIGPSLAAFNVPGTLGDPSLALKNSSGTTLATSATIWDQSSNVSDIRTASNNVGAFALTAGSRDAVILTSLAPGNYTAVTSSPSGGSGVVLVEAYDADTVRDSTSRLANLSSRGLVQTGANVLIAGFVVSGPGPHTYLIRVAGDTLQSLGVSGTLDDPILTLFSGNGAQLRLDDDWDSPTAAQPALKSAFTQVGAFTFTDRQESAMLVTLPPGNYTAQASGNTNNGSTSAIGVGLIEIYEMP